MVAPRVLAEVFYRLDGLRLPAAAAMLARAGVPVFPCAPGKKQPIPKRGFHEATTDLRRVESWWRSRPAANIGVPTGAVSGLVVIDVDLHGVDGHAGYARAARAGLIPEPLAIVRTPSGGMHAYFPAYPGREQRSWQAGNVGIDCRGDGGYIIAPPSMLRLDGDRIPYRLEHLSEHGPQPVDAGRVRDFLDPRPAPRPRTGRPIDSKDAQQLASWLGRQTKDRNLKLFWAACRLAEGHVPLADTIDAMTVAEQPDFGKREIERTIHSAYRRITGGGGTGQIGSTLSANPPPGGFIRHEPQPRAPAGRGLA